MYSPLLGLQFWLSVRCGILGSALRTFPYSYLDAILSIAEAQQEVQLVGFHGLKVKMQQLLDLQNSTITSIQDSLQGVGHLSSLQHQKQHQLLETLQELILLGAQGAGDQAGNLGQAPDDEGRNWAGTLFNIQDHLGLGSILGKVTLLATWTTEITISNNNSDSNGSKRHQTRLHFLIPQVLGSSPTPLPASVSPSFQLN